MDVATSAVSQTINLDDVRRAHQILHSQSGPTELRVKIGEGAMSGVFDDDAKLFEWIANADESAVPASWWSIQAFNGVPIHNDLQYRGATGNKDVQCRRFIVVDIDTVRDIDPATGKPFAAASESELAATRAKQAEVNEWLKARGVAPLMTVMSGNGFQIYIRVNDWPNGDVPNNVAKAFLKMLASKFSDGAAVIDTAVARIGGLARIPGTVNRKGENTLERPWRVAQIVDANVDVKALSAEFVRQLVEDEGCEVEQPIAKRQFAGMHPDFDAENFAEWLGTSIVSEHVGSDGRLYYDVSPCPNVGSDHRGAPSKCCLVVWDGGIGFSCFSDDCEGVTIGDLMRKACEENGYYTEPLFDEPDPLDILPVEDIGPNPVPEAERIVTAAELFANSEPLTAVGATAEVLQAPPEAQVAKAEDPLKFPDDAMYGKLGEMAYAMKTPRGLTYPALIGCYSVKPIYDEMDGNRINADVILLAGLGGGKDTAIKRALQILKLEKGVEYEKATPASDRGVGELLGDKLSGKKGQERQSGPKRMLLVCDEFMEVLQKSRIENSGLFQTLQTLFDDNRKVFADKRGRQTVDCRLSIVGSIPVNEKNPELFAELFGRKSSHGLLSRILLGYSGTKFNYKPWTCPDISIGKSVSTRVDTSFDGDDLDLPADEWQPAPRVEGLTPEARDLYEAWDHPADESGRAKFYLMKVALLTASANGDVLVTAEGMQAAIKFMAWQARLREVFKPGIAEDIIDARATERIINTLRRKAENMGDDEYIAWRRVSHDCKWVESFGSPVVDRVITSLINCGELVAREVEDEKGKVKLDKRWVKVVGKVPHGGK